MLYRTGPRNTFNREIHLKLKHEWVDQVYSASYKNGKKRGVALLFNKSVYYHIEELIQDDEG